MQGYGYTDGEITVDLLLKDGLVMGQRVLVPPTFEKSSLRSNVELVVRGWSFPAIKEEGTCSVDLHLVTTPFFTRNKDKIDEWRGKKRGMPYITEMMMRPMMPGQGTAPKGSQSKDAK